MKYHYIGPIYHFGKVVIKQFNAVTEAVSEKKALSNICYRAKTSLGYKPTWKVEAYSKYLKEEPSVNDEVQLTMKL